MLLRKPRPGGAGYLHLVAPWRHTSTCPDSSNKPATTEPHKKGMISLCVLTALAPLGRPKRAEPCMTLSACQQQQQQQQSMAHAVIVLSFSACRFLDRVRCVLTCLAEPVRYPWSAMTLLNLSNMDLSFIFVWRRLHTFWPDPGTLTVRSCRCAALWMLYAQSCSVLARVCRLLCNRLPNNILFQCAPCPRHSAAALIIARSMQVHFVGP